MYTAPIVNPHTGKRCYVAKGFFCKSVYVSVTGHTRAYAINRWMRAVCESTGINYKNI